MLANQIDNHIHNIRDEQRHVSLAVENKWTPWKYRSHGNGNLKTTSNNTKILYLLCGGFCG